eukprot:TRINITY_DN2977_c0_g2_i2.p1 TRINITY_DN2977_c0_g2~~TRINITY_DN2977_c0_g2_i2.p1  ORF type:complete len:549 (-),score=154.99 TRINITY_DN2977_c0_g2_i2:534-2180(-)
MKIDQVLEAHKERRKKDKNAIMTTILKKAPPTHRTRSFQDDVMVAIDKSSGRLLYFDNDPKTRTFQVEMDIIKNHPEVTFRYDLLDCRIDICSPEVLSLFADNYDWEDLRKDFVIGILTSELLTDAIYTHVISGEYAARVKCLRTYEAVSMDVIHRWPYPFVPDNNFLSAGTSYTHRRNGRYIEKDVKLSGKCEIHSDTVIGEGSIIGDDTHIYSSVIGRRCKIGKNVVIKGSFIWDDAIIEDNVVIETSIVCNGARVLQKCNIQRGCVLSFNTSVGPGVNLPAHSKITTYEIPEGEEEDEIELKPINLGKYGNGKDWVSEFNKNNLLGVEYKISDEKEIDEEIKQEYDLIFHRGLVDALPSAGKDQENFEKEAHDIILNGITDDAAFENIAMELNALKFAYNESFANCCVMAVQTLLEHCSGKSGVALLTAVQSIMSKYSTNLIQKFFGPGEEEEETKIEVLWGFVEFCQEDKKEREEFKKLFPKLLQVFYDEDIVDEESILEWSKQAQKAEKKDEQFYKLALPFIDWLQQAEEESEEDDDEEEEDE